MSKAEMPEIDQSKACEIKMTTRQWQIIDATIDNEIDTAATSGRGAELGNSVRQAGWNQIVGTTGVWPPENQVIFITMPGRQWHFVTTALSGWAAVSESLDLHDDAQLARQIRALVEGQLTA